MVVGAERKFIGCADRALIRNFESVDEKNTIFLSIVMNGDKE